MINSYYDELYKKIFEQEFSGLEKRRANDRLFTPDDLKRQLNDLYEAQGGDWLGRGEVGNVTYDATIAAFESFCAAWERARGEKNDGRN